MIGELLCPFVEHGQLRNVSGQCFRQGTGEPPLPVGALGAGSVDAGLTAQMQPIRQRDHSAFLPPKTKTHKALLLSPILTA